MPVLALPVLIMPLTERRLNSIRNIRQSIGQNRISVARQKNNIWWFNVDVRQKIFPKLNVYPRLYPKSFTFSYFARFVNQHPQKRNLYECTHALPFRGVGCFLSRKSARAQDILQQIRKTRLHTESVVSGEAEYRKPDEAFTATLQNGVCGEGDAGTNSSTFCNVLFCSLFENIFASYSSLCVIVFRRKGYYFT